MLIADDDAHIRTLMHSVVEDLLSEGRPLTPDLGGTAKTVDVTRAIVSRLGVPA